MNLRPVETLVLLFVLGVGLIAWFCLLQGGR